MNHSPAELIARAVLYEGYILYPYRATAIKNRHRWTFGGLAPRSVAEANSEPWFLRAECLLCGDERTELCAWGRFLHPVARTGGSLDWQEAVEREMCIPAVALGELINPRAIEFAFPASRSVEGVPTDRIERVQHALEVTAELSVVKLTPRVFRLTLRVCNHTSCATNADRDEVALRTLLSAHVALSVQGGKFVSLTDPPGEFRALAAECRNEGVWPVLVGTPGDSAEMLASPIILPDYPRIAPESSGDFFDGAEIDEMLALRVLTLTDDEKRQMVATDSRARAILQRVESLPQEQMLALHGANRSAPRGLRAGERVRLCPRGRADAFDILLAGKIATIASVEVDFEGTTHFAVTLDDDPGGDLGATGQIGHRFFFRADEVEPLAEGES